MIQSPDDSGKAASYSDAYLPISRKRNKTCPMISDAEKFINCGREICAWWDTKYERCAVVGIAFKK